MEELSVVWLEPESTFAAALGTAMKRHAKPTRLRLRIIASEDRARHECRRGADGVIAGARDCVRFVTEVAMASPSRRILVLADGLTCREVDEMESVGARVRPKGGALDDAERLVDYLVNREQPSATSLPLADDYETMLDMIERMRGSGNPTQVLEELERRIRQRALERFGGNVSATANWLGVRRTTLTDRMRKCGALPRSASCSAAE